MLSYKDQIPKVLQSGVVYKFSCNSCNAIYIGKTIRHLKVRASEHLGISHLTGKRVIQYTHTAIGDHILSCDHAASLDNFKIVARDSSNYILEIKESLLISHDKPSLNKTVMSAPLYLYN